MVEILKEAKRISLINEPLYYYRRRLEGASNDYKINEKRLSEITAQKKVLESIEEYDSPTLIDMVQMRLYYCGYKIMRLAYYEDQYNLFLKIDKDIDIGRNIWYKTHNNFLGNCRRKLVESMMRIRIPKGLVKIFDKNDMIEWE